MDNFSVQDPVQKRLTGLKALILEILVVIFLVVIVFLALAYFNIIDISPLLGKDIKKQTTVLPNNSQTIPSSTDTKLSFAEFLARNADQAVLNVLFKGTIKTISHNEFTLYGIKYQHVIELRNQKGVVYKLNFNKESLANYSLTQTINGEKKPLDINDLKEGDSISINEVFDFTKGPEFIPAPGSTLIKN